MIVADIRVEPREHFEHRIRLFSGIDFNVDPESGLMRVCDFLISLSANLARLGNPASKGETPSFGRKIAELTFKNSKLLSTPAIRCLLYRSLRNVVGNRVRHPLIRSPGSLLHRFHRV